ncbi:MAG TPA: VTT domain-containing protein [Acidobacteriota bacterium]|nr:VTT domain-containing protein [Acidobacteriota bacterium]
MLYLQPWMGRVGEFLQVLATKMDGFGLMLVAMMDSSFLSIPEGNDVLIVVLSSGSTWRGMAFYVAMTITGSVLGCLLLYTVGRKGGSPLLRRKFSQSNVERAERLFEKYGILTVVIPSILPPPCPFKIFVLSAGVFELRLWEFLAAVVAGRTLRYSMWGILAVMYGRSVRTFMRQNLPVVGALMFAVFLLVVSVVIFVYLRRQSAAKNKAQLE